MNSMKSVVMCGGRVQLEEVVTPKPGKGQVLVKSLACGICGSDLHIARHADEVFRLLSESGLAGVEKSEEPLQISLGHEFCAEIVAYGPATEQALPIGQRVTSIPFLLSGDQPLGIGTSPGVYGAYSEYFVLQESLLLPVPDQLPSQAVTLAEPMAVGLHAVNMGALTTSEVAMVLGCGPVGLACVIALKRRGIKHIIASDPVEANRHLALKVGASHAINPQDEDDMALASDLANGSRIVILECVGKPDLIPQLIRHAPERTCIVFTGLHTADVSIGPGLAMIKQLNLRFSYYYSPEEFCESLAALASGEICWSLLHTGSVGIDGVANAFEQLFKPNDHIKVIVEPWREGSLTRT